MFGCMLVLWEVCPSMRQCGRLRKGFKRQIPSRHRREQESVTTEMAINKSETTNKGVAGIEVGCKEACRLSRKRKQLKAA